MRARPAPVPSSIGIGVIAFLLLGTPIGAVAQETEELPVTLKADSYQVAYATADELQVYPNDKGVGRHVSWWVAGHRLFPVPYFIIFLRERRGANISPVIGYGDVEGWFVKTSWSYFVNENHYGFVHADWYERLGVGAGIEHLYRSAGGEGSVLVYGLANRQTGGTDAHDFLNHLQRLGDVTLRTFVDYQDLSSSTGSPTTNLFATLDLSTQTQQSSTYMFSTLFESSASPVSTLTSQFAHLQNFGPRLGAEVLLNYDQTGDPTGVDQELLPRITLRYFSDGVAATLVTDTRWDLDGTHSTADDKYILERLPELTVTVSPFRVGGTPLYAQAVVGLAQFRETTPGPTG